MTIISSGQLALQDAGTNPTTTVDNVLLNTSFTAHVDGFLQIKQLYEAGDGYYLPATAWQGYVFGFINSIFSSSYIHNVFPIYATAGIGNRSYSSQSNIGSLGATTYTDTAGTSTVRTIKGLTWGIPDASSTEKLFVFALSGTIIPNSDTTFSKIEITTSGGTTVTINRSDLSYDASENGHSFWWWSGTSGTMNTNVTNLGQPNNSSYTLKVYSGTITTTPNNGIAEEFDGDDSSDVKLSDYYAGGTYTPSGTTGIPTSGQIKFSDFFGTSKIITNTYSATGTNTSWGKGSRQRIGRVLTSYYVGGAQGSGGTPSPLSTDGFGLSLTCQAAAWYEGASSSLSGFRWEATSSSSTGANTTWWNKVTISRSGQTDVVLLRSSATTNAMANYRYSIFWPSLYVNTICEGAFTWTFSS